MARFALQVKGLTNGEPGGNLVRSIAYRSGTNITSEYTGSREEYSYRADVIYSGVLFPRKLAGDPRASWWNLIPGGLANAIERHALKRQKAAGRSSLEGVTIARDITAVLPDELMIEGKPERSKARFDRNIKLSREYFQELADRHNVPVFFAVHDRTNDSDPEPERAAYPHTHGILMGYIVTNKRFGRRSFNQKSWGRRNEHGVRIKWSRDLAEIRKLWATKMNDAFREAGLDLRVTHKGRRTNNVLPPQIDQHELQDAQQQPPQVDHRMLGKLARKFWHDFQSSAKARDSPAAESDSNKSPAGPRDGFERS